MDAQIVAIAVGRAILVVQATVYYSVLLIMAAEIYLVSRVALRVGHSEFYYHIHSTS
jgi:hypothetical protein